MYAKVFSEILVTLLFFIIFLIMSEMWLCLRFKYSCNQSAAWVLPKRKSREFFSLSLSLSVSPWKKMSTLGPEICTTYVVLWYCWSVGDGYNHGPSFHDAIRRFHPPNGSRNWYRSVDCVTMWLEYIRRVRANTAPISKWWFNGQRENKPKIVGQLFYLF